MVSPDRLAGAIEALKPKLPEPSSTSLIGAYVEAPVKDAIRHLAESRGVSQSEVIREALKEFFQRKLDQTRPPLPGIGPNGSE